MIFLKKIKKIIPSNFYINIFLLIIFSFVGALLELLGIGMVLPAVEVLLEKESFIFDKLNIYFRNIIPLQVTDDKILILYLLIIIFVFKNVLLMFFHWYTVNFNVRLIEKLSTNLINHYLQSEYIFLLRKSTSEVIRNLVGECSIFNKKVLIPILYISMDIVIFIGLISLLLIVEFRITSVIIVFLVSLILFYYFFSKKLLKKLGLQRQKFSKQVLKSTQEAFQGLKIIKIFKKEIYFKNLFSDNMTKNLNVEKNQSLILTAPRLLTEIIFVSIFVFFIIYLIKLNIIFVDIIPQLTICFVAAVRLIPTVNRLSLNIQTIRYGKSSVDLLYEEFNKFENENNISTENNKTLELNDNIELKNINFSYDNKKSILNSINLKIKKGSMIGIVGQTGEGKSTLVNILTGLLKPTSGSIFLDNNLFKDNLYDSKNFIGYVPQDTFLLDGTIKQNIVFTLEEEFNYNEKNLNKALKLSKLEKFVDSLPNNLNSQIGENGSKLSGGQQQRVSIARALYRDPKILIFDESTSSLDVDTERQIVKDIEQMKVDKTIIIISHRETTLKYCDEIYKIHDTKLDKIK